MGVQHKEFVEKAKMYLKELVPGAEGISFEEFSHSLPVENPPNAVVVVLSYTDSDATKSLAQLFARKVKGVYLDPISGELLAVKNKLG